MLPIVFIRGILVAAYREPRREYDPYGPRTALVVFLGTSSTAGSIPRILERSSLSLLETGTTLSTAMTVIPPSESLPNGAAAAHHFLTSDTILLTSARLSGVLSFSRQFLSTASHTASPLR